MGIIKEFFQGPLNGKMSGLGAGFRVQTLNFVPRGVTLETGLQNGAKRRRMGIEMRFIGTSLPFGEAKNIAGEINSQMSFFRRIIPGLKARVVVDPLGQV